MSFLVRYRKEIFIFILIAITYFVLRLPNLTLQPIFADEAIYIRWAQVMRAEPTLRFLPLSDGKTPLFMWALMPVLKFTQDPLFAGRLLSVLSGFFTLLGVFFLSKKVFNLKAAIWASLLYVIVPYTVFFDRMALVDSMLSTFTVWALYFTIWLGQSLRLDQAMILGYLLGASVLVKTSGMLNLLLLPSSILVFKRQTSGSYGLLKLLIFWAVAMGIALLMYNLLRLGPNFQLLSSRNADYIFSPLDLVGRPLDPFIPHLQDIADWFPKLFTWPILVLVGVGVFHVVTKFDRLGLVVLLWAVIPILLSMAFLKTYTARYLLPSIPPLLVLAGFGLEKLLNQMKPAYLLKTLATLVIISPLALIFNYQLLINPPPISLPQEERHGYFEQWTAGYGFKEIATFLMEKGKTQKVVVGTEGFFGTLPDGLYIYLDKANISIVGSTATISAEIRQAADDHLTFFVGNKNRLEGSLDNVKLIKQYPKAKPSSGPPDAILFYQVFPR